MNEPRKEKPLYAYEPIDLARELLVDLGINTDDYFLYISLGEKLIGKTPQGALDYLSECQYPSHALIICAVVAPDNLFVKEWGETEEIREAFATSAENYINSRSVFSEFFMKRYTDGGIMSIDAPEKNLLHLMLPQKN